MIVGTAQLLLPLNDWFHGHFFAASRRYGITANQRLQHECLRDGLNGEYECTILDYEEKRQITLEVYRSGGDLVTLHDTSNSNFQNLDTKDFKTSKLHFETIKLLSGDKAVQHIRRFFPNISSPLSDQTLYTYTVAIGHMSLNNFDFTRGRRILDTAFSSSHFVQSESSSLSKKQSHTLNKSNSNVSGTLKVAVMCENNTRNKRTNVAIKASGGWIQSNRLLKKKKKGNHFRAAFRDQGISISQSQQIEV